MTLEHASEIRPLEFLPDGHLASGNNIGEIMLWDSVHWLTYWSCPSAQLEYQIVCVTVPIKAGIGIIEDSPSVGYGIVGIYFYV